jgi:hypothetical protein
MSKEQNDSASTPTPSQSTPKVTPPPPPPPASNTPDPVFFTKSIDFNESPQKPISPEPPSQEERSE